MNQQLAFAKSQLAQAQQAEQIRIQRERERAAAEAERKRQADAQAAEAKRAEQEARLKEQSKVLEALAPVAKNLDTLQNKVTQIEAAETGDKEFFAHWQKNETPVKTWNIFYFTDGGVINGVYPTTYVEGKGAKLPTSVTKKGYTFLGWFTKDGVRITRIGAEATGDVTVYAHWTLDALYPSVLDAIFGDMDFSDVSPRDWFYKDVEYVYEKGIMDGIDKHTFAPDANLTRGMLVTILYRIEGEPVTRGSTDFTDVELGRWYTKAVAWAASKDIVNGYGGGKFGPNDPVTREQLTTILYRYTAYKGESTAAFSGNLNRFKDAASVSNYAVDAANWAVGEGIINGSGDLFMPKSNATRAQVAAIIHRYLAG